MPNNLHSAVNAFDKTQAKKVKEHFGILGLPVSQKTVNVPNRNGYVYVRLRDNESEIIQAYNEEVSPVWGLPVVVIRQGNGWRIKGRDIERYNNWGSDSAFLPSHHYQHEFNPNIPGGDVVFIYPQAFVPLLVTPSGTDGGPNVIMQSVNFKKDDGSWLQAGVTGTSSLLVYKPTDGTAIIGLAYLNRDTGNPGFLINSGSAPLASVTGTYDLLQYLPDLPSNDYEPLAMIRLVSGTESVGWQNLYDIRQFFASTVTGTGGGGVEEAPIDGKVYGRKDADWTEVSGTSGGLPTLNAERVVVTDDTGTITDDWHFTYDIANNLLVIGSSLDKVPFSTQNSLFVIGSGSSPSMGLAGFGSDIAPFYTFVRARGDWTTPTAIQHGDVIGRNRFRGHDGYAFPATRAEIRAQAVGVWTTGSHGTEVIVGVTPSGTTTMVDMLKVNQAGVDIPYGTYLISGSGIDYENISANDPNTDVTGAELETLTDGSNADALHGHSYLLPFGVFQHISPLSASPSFPYGQTVDRSLSLVTWYQHYYVVAPNDGSNYWEIKLARISDGATVATLSTAAVSANTQGVLNTSTFAINPITTAMLMLYVKCDKVGSPGNLYAAGPALKVTG